MSEKAQAHMTLDEIKAWRKAQRPELIARREAISAEQRTQWNQRITVSLIDGFPTPPQAVIGFCWPYKGEFDARFAVHAWRVSGAQAALPEVIQNRAPLQFRLWRPGVAMRAGVYDIPVPVDTAVVTPDVAIVPMNGFDDKGYRLGYGGGFFDRTLAACEPRMIAIGVTYEALRLATIHPQPHDIAMDFVVTEAAIYSTAGGRLQALDCAESAKRYARLMLGRRLPRADYSSEVSSPVCYANEFPSRADDESTA
ncbi:MAG: 5-formyltetrahydrofolate cyclo-ligase [Pseudomonadota bacterium]